MASWRPIKQSRGFGERARFVVGTKMVLTQMEMNASRGFVWWQCGELLSQLYKSGDSNLPWSKAPHT